MSESDWELYGEYVSLNIDDSDWDNFISEHWLEEENRRLWNYFHPYFNDDKNIKWVYFNKLTFIEQNYNDCISQFRDYKC